MDRINTQFGETIIKENTISDTMRNLTNQIRLIVVTVENSDKS